jgi:hypothetical protein
VGELVERFKSLGVCASRAGVTAALAELGMEIELSSWAPWRLLAAINQSPSSNRRRTERILHKISDAQEHDCDDKDSRSTKKNEADFVEFGKTGLPDLIVVILADNRPVAARVQKLQISKEEEPGPQE